MLVTNGKQERNISEKQLPEYERKGYAAVKPAAEPKPKKTAKKAVK
jgi:hypothetical protein